MLHVADRVSQAALDDLAAVRAPVAQPPFELFERRRQDKYGNTRGHRLTHLPGALPVDLEDHVVAGLQVLFNLVDNAIKYSRHAQHKEITISGRREEGGLLLSVADRGPGVPPHHMKAIFQPFYRAENELTRSSKGTGIGLALVRGLVDRMGGSVHCENAETGGFVASISLRSASA